MDPMFDARSRPTAALPLLGTTVLVVEDSRYASDAIRMMCQKSGARVRRADSLEHARKHLRVYRPSVAIIDLGLPDGAGEDLIRELASAQPRIDAIFGMSGDPYAGVRAIKAGADAFMAKPIQSLAGFQATLLKALPLTSAPLGPRDVDATPIEPDPLALRDDLRHAAEVLKAPDRSTTRYVGQFVAGLARSAGDASLLNAAEALVAGSLGRPGSRRALCKLIDDRIANDSLI